VLIVQLAGEKTWDVRAASREVPMYRDAAANDTPSEEVVWAGRLRAGEVMHIPRGFWHRATRADCGDGFSLHLTFGFVKRTGVSWVSWLADCARREELFRRDLRRADGGDSWSEELIGAAQKLAAENPPNVFLSAREDERGSRRHVRTRGVLGAPTAVVCITDFAPRLAVGDESVAVVAAGKRITFVPHALPALRLLLSGVPVRLDDVHDATGVDVTRLVEVLLEEEVCAELTDELSSGYIGLVTTEEFSKPRLTLASGS
ncbi:MAG: JmjC domain-containing protein, partial [Thermocrispum sp.]